MQSRSVLAVLLLAGCTESPGNELGHLSATKHGDQSNLAARSSPVADIRAECGEGHPTLLGTAMFRRPPYVQDVTTTTATLGWVTLRDTAPTMANFAGNTAVARATEEITRNSSEVQHWTSLSGLNEGSIVCYDVADANGMLAGRTGFRTAPAADSEAPVRFLAFGDSGGGGVEQRALLEQMYTVPFELMVHTGDIAYEDGTIHQFEDRVFSVYKDLWRNIPFFPSPGNHDYVTDDGATYRDVFALPSAGAGQPTERWYSYNWGRVHFVALDTMADWEPQMEWLDRDLAGSDRPWTVLYMHHPPFSSGPQGSEIEWRDLLVPVIRKHNVQLVLAGHDHHYERSKPLEGTHYIVTGGGGMGTRKVSGSSFTAFVEQVIHFVYIEVLEDEAILHAIDATGVEFDSVRIPVGSNP